MGQLDIFDAASWPSERFQVLAGSSVSGRFRDGREVAFQRHFRRLAATALAPNGLALYTFHFPELVPEVLETLREALGVEELLVSLYQQPERSSEWREVSIEHLRPQVVHLLVMRKAATTSFP